MAKFSGRRHRGLAAMAAALCALVATVPAAASDPLAQDLESGAWELVMRSGSVEMATAAGDPLTWGLGRPLPPGISVATGANGRAILTRGRDVVRLGPGSALSLPAPEGGDAPVEVLQSKGRARYEIDADSKDAVGAEPRFQVTAPGLVARADGTTFDVTVGAAASSVAVRQGLAQVAEADGSAARAVVGGETATGGLGEMEVAATPESDARRPTAPLLRQARLIADSPKAAVPASGRAASLRDALAPSRRKTTSVEE